MKYKISEVSKITNIPIDTIRYLETKNIVNPKRNDNNNYRSYEAWDINFLLEFKQLRSYGFSVADVEEIQNYDDLNDFIERISERQCYFEEKIKYYNILKEKNNHYLNSLNNIEKNIGRYIFTKHPNIYYFTHRFNYKYETKDKFEGLFEIWLSYYPIIENIVEMKFDSIINGNNDYKWGFAIRVQYAKALNIPINNNVKHKEGVDSVYTVICAGDKGSFSLKLLDDAIKFIEDKGYTLAGDVIGNLLARVHEPNGYQRYVEVWIPIKNK